MRGLSNLMTASAQNIGMDMQKGMEERVTPPTLLFSVATSDVRATGIMPTMLYAPSLGCSQGEAIGDAPIGKVSAEADVCHAAQRDVHSEVDGLDLAEASDHREQTGVGRQQFRKDGLDLTGFAQVSVPCNVNGILYQHGETSLGVGGLDLATCPVGKGISFVDCGGASFRSPTAPGCTDKTEGHLAEPNIGVVGLPTGDDKDVAVSHAMHCQGLDLAGAQASVMALCSEQAQGGSGSEPSQTRKKDMVMIDSSDDEVCVPRDIMQEVNVKLASLQGWWLMTSAGEPILLDLSQIGGRTVRQEREALGLLSVDACKSSVTVLSREGCLQATWSFKFPHSARDGALLIVREDGHKRRLDKDGQFQFAAAQLDRLCKHGLSCNEKRACENEAGWSNVELESRTEVPGQPAQEKASGCDKATETARAPPSVCDRGLLATDAVLFAFLSGWRCVDRRPNACIRSVLEDEWGIPASMFVITVHGKRVSPDMQLAAIPQGVPVRVSARLRGGGQHAVKKLKELLLSKGVPEQDIQGRIESISDAIGENGIQESFSTFDPWQSLKAKCQGRVRIIKPTEMKQKTKRGEETDPLQENDPWSQAIQERSFTPDASFFTTSTGRPPLILPAVMQGHSGLVVIDQKDAQALASNPSHLSPDELGALVFGECPLDNPCRPVRKLEFPCVDGKGARLLAKGTLIDLGSVQLKVAGEDKIHAMPVSQTSILACELHRGEIDQWAEAAKSPVRFLKTALALGNDDIVQIWGKKTFRQGKPEHDQKEIDAIFFMMRIRENMLEHTLKALQPGIYTAPRSESGQPDHSFRIVWVQDKLPRELRTIAATMKGSLGIAKSKSGCGIRVRCADYVTAKQTLQPEWAPQEATPYDAHMQRKFELHHFHEAAGRSEIQTLLNSIPWRALVLRQRRPGQWLVAAEADPLRDTVLTEHGCILIVPVQDNEPGRASKGKGKGKRSKGSPWLIGGRPFVQHSAATVPPAAPCEFQSAPVDPHGPIQSALQGLEEKMEQRLEGFRQEAKATHAILEKDLCAMRDDLKEQAEKQRSTALELNERVNGVESALTGQLAQFMTSLQSTLAQQKTELSGQIQSGHETLRSELTTELRSQMSAIRKRTPSPSQSTDNEGDKRMKGK